MTEREQASCKDKETWSREEGWKGTGRGNSTARQMTLREA